jgi:hypothetical protein
MFHSTVTYLISSYHTEMMLMQVAQYASSNGQGKAATDAVDECLRYMMTFSVRVYLFA